MNEIIKSIKSENFEITFRLTADKDEWYAKISNLGGFEHIEFSINLDHYFSEESWTKLPDFIEFLNENLNHYFNKAIDTLTKFAKMTGYFNEEEQSFLDFGFGHCIIFKDNSFTVTNRWEFELDFSTNNKKDSLENIDGYGRWFVTFNGNCISGIRRENW
ncbi:hypothetical protein [Pedobacter frigiditerrae]|uniref:hypothetical protein n=1 Tax=Pedobacter frigiditerrae TaxID=2530452 RepID=UPI00292DCF49|nr:hypothetical protein [Pedobacter frigiditerrae]